MYMVYDALFHLGTIISNIILRLRGKLSLYYSRGEWVRPTFMVDLRGMSLLFEGLSVLEFLSKF